MDMTAFGVRHDDDQTPLYLWVDPTNACNLSCAYCYTKHSHGLTHLTPARLDFLIDWLQPVLPRIRVFHLNWRGEPLMNPEFEKLLQIFGRRIPAIPMHWHTNGTLLTKKRAHRLVDSAPAHSVFVSIDGGTLETHERNRGRDSFRPALAGLRNLLEANESAGRPIKVGIYQIELGISPDDYDPEFRELSARASQWIKVLPLEHDGTEGMHVEAYDSACFWAGHALCVDSFGKVAVCVISRGEDGTVGHIDRDDVFAVIERAREWRDDLTHQGRHARRHCRNCRKKNGAPMPADVTVHYDVTATDPVRNIASR